MCTGTASLIPGTGCLKRWLIPAKKASTGNERIIAYLNSRLKTRYTLTDATRAKIDARFAEGHTVEDFITVIDTKATEWLGSDCRKISPAGDPFRIQI